MLTKTQAGRRGGLATFARHGPEHMRAIGRAGARTFWRRYRMTPAGQSGWAILARDTGAVVNFIGALPFQRKAAAPEEARRPG